MFRVLVGCLLVVSCAHAQEHWPRFRGPNGQGVAEAAGVPIQWSEATTLWRAKLTGGGHGSPVVWGEHVYLMSGAAGSAVLECYDLTTGARRWRAEHQGKPTHLHTLNSSSATTPAVDSHGVYVSWADAEGFYLAAYTHLGDLVWEESFGAYHSSHGYSRSPVVVDGNVVLASNQQSGSFVAAFDPVTGKPTWRQELPASKASYGTPCVIDQPGGAAALVTCSSEGAAHALDAATGEVLWSLPGVLPQRSVGSPIFAGGLVIFSSGSGGGGKLLAAVAPPDAEHDQPQLAYSIAKAAPYVPTPLAMDDLLILWHERGTVAAFDLATGERLWEQRIGGKAFASPLAVDGLVLNLTMAGEAIFLRADRQGCEVVARNDLQEPTEATPAVVAGRLLISTEESLLCIGTPKTAHARTNHR